MQRKTKTHQRNTQLHMHTNDQSHMQIHKIAELDWWSDNKNWMHLSVVNDFHCIYMVFKEKKLEK